jgi:hypothetical protein
MIGMTEFFADTGLSDGDAVRIERFEHSEPNAVAQSVLVSLPEGRASAVGEATVTIDRELRRVLAIDFSDSPDRYNSNLNSPPIFDSREPIYDANRPRYGYRRLADEKRKTQLPRPVSAFESRLELAAFERGSANLLFDVYGDLVTLLTGSPVTALVALVTLAQAGNGGVKIVKGWISHATSTRHEYLAEVSRQGGDPQLVLGDPEINFTVDHTPLREARVLRRRITSIAETTNGDGTVLRKTTTIEEFD